MSALRLVTLYFKVYLAERDKWFNIMLLQFTNGMGSNPVEGKTKIHTRNILTEKCNSNFQMCMSLETK